MSLKELTANKHAAAEGTQFMRAVFDKKMNPEVWIDWLYQKHYFYNIIEDICRNAGYLDDLPGIERTEQLFNDWAGMTRGKIGEQMNPVVYEYIVYLKNLEPRLVLAHLYTWHMGDMFGGQMIKKILPGPHTNLEFDDADTLKTNLRAKLDDSLGDEANNAFDWAIRMMNTYNSQLPA